MHITYKSSVHWFDNEYNSEFLQFYSWKSTLVSLEKYQHCNYNTSHWCRRNTYHKPCYRHIFFLVSLSSFKPSTAVVRILEPSAPLIIGPWLRAINFIPTRNARLIECHRSCGGHLRVARDDRECFLRGAILARCVDGLHQVAPGSAALFILARTRVRSRAAVPFLAALWRTSAVAVIAAV